MGLKKLMLNLKFPCSKCPYMLGQVAFVANPCFECKKNNYATYYRLVNEQPNGVKAVKNENSFEQ